MLGKKCLNKILKSFLGYVVMENEVNLAKILRFTTENSLKNYFKQIDYRKLRFISKNQVYADFKVEMKKV